MVEAICKELALRKDELPNPVESIYIGGGSPSILKAEELQTIFRFLYDHYHVLPGAEITIEANPDDLTLEKLEVLKQIKVNRLSIGIQSFDDTLLTWMNRSHNGMQAEIVIQNAYKAGFENLTIDLIYGIPGLSDEAWKNTLEKAMGFGIKHISSYCLTVEKKTALAHLIAKGTYANPDEEQAARQFEILTQTLLTGGFEHYEISNFAKNGAYSLHNSNYWKGATYIGIGPAAHSYNGFERSWNIANNQQYLNALLKNNLPSEKEILTPANRFNEYIMTGMRTKWGCEIRKLETEFGTFYSRILPVVEEKLALGFMQNNNGYLVLTEKGKFLADGIASDLFI